MIGPAVACRAHGDVAVSSETPATGVLVMARFVEFKSVESSLPVAVNADLVVKFLPSPHDPRITIIWSQTKDPISVQEPYAEVAKKFFGI
jgi:hypothetical protein